MLKNKRILLIIIAVIALFLIPSVCNAAAIPATETTETSTGKTVKWSYELNGDVIVDLKCTNLSELSGELPIPSTIDGYTVVAIGNNKDTYTSISSGAFENCNGLTGITIPNTVTTIGSEAFRGCIGIKSITIPNSVTSIGQYAFYECSGITSIILSENITKIGEYAFQSCTGIKQIELPNSLVSIEKAAFYGCTGLKQLKIPNSVTSIGDSAFRGCTGLTSLVIPDNVTSLGESAFQECSGITSLTVSKNLTIIRELTFYKCTSLKSVIIPDSVTTIEGNNYDWYGAFAGCSNLEKVYIPDSVATIEKGAFLKCPKLTIYGSDNQASKKYAEDNEINFNYLANWDKTPEGADITPPTLESLRIVWGTAFEKDSGTGYYLVYVDTNISIKATFNENVYGQKAPTLTIKCGNGENIILNDGVIQGDYIMYTYRIQDKDKGIISAVSLTGGDIADAKGNKIEKYTCPALTTDLFNEQVFANGTGTIVNNQGSGNNSGGNNGNNGSTTIILSSIAITKAPTKTTYTEGEKFDKTGMGVTAIYSDGTKKEVTNYTVSTTETLKTVDKKIVISYTENGVTKTVEQAITVNAKPVIITLTSIAITKAPTKTNYTEGNTFSKNGMVVTAIYSDGTKKEVTNYSASPSGALKTTDKKIVISYTENGVTKTVDQTISVSKKVVKDENDTTTKEDNKLPQTGATLLSFLVISLIAVAIISKVRYGKYKDI